MVTKQASKFLEGCSNLSFLSLFKRIITCLVEVLE